MGYTTKYNSLEGPSYYDAGFEAWWQGRIEEYRQGAMAAEGESDSVESKSYCSPSLDTVHKGSSL